MRSWRSNVERPSLRVSFCRSPYVELEDGETRAEMSGRSRSGHRLLCWLIVSERRGGGFERQRGGRGRGVTLQAIGGGTDGLKGARRDLRRALEGLAPGLRDEIFPVSDLRGESDALSLDRFDVEVDVIRLTGAMDAAADARLAGEQLRAAELSAAALDELSGAWDGDAVRSWLQPQREALIRFRERLERICLDAWTAAVVDAAQSQEVAVRADGRTAAERLVAIGGIADVAESYLLLSDTVEQQRRCRHLLQAEADLSDEVRGRLDQIAEQQRAAWREPGSRPGHPSTRGRVPLLVTVVALLAVLLVAAGAAAILRGGDGDGATGASRAGVGPGPKRATLPCGSSWNCTSAFPHVTFNSLTEAPDYGDTRDFLRARGHEETGTARDPITDEDEDVTVWLRIENNGDEARLGRAAIARDVEVRLAVPRAAAARQVLAASIEASNAVPAVITDTLTIRGRQPFTVRVVEQWIWRTDPDGNLVREAADRTLAGAGIEIGDWGAGAEHRGYVEARLELAPALTAVASASTVRGYYPPRDAVACEAGGHCPGTVGPSLNALRFTGATLPQGIPDERRFLNGAVDSGEVRAPRDPLTVRPGDRIRVEAVVDNGARLEREAATNVRVWLGMPAESGKTVDLLAAVSGSDVDEPVVSDSLTIASEDPFYLMYEPGSARLRTGRQRTAVPDAVLGMYAPDDLERRALGGRGVRVGCELRDGRWPGTEECAGVLSAIFQIRYAASPAYRNTLGEPTAAGGQGELRYDGESYVVSGRAGPGYDYPTISNPVDGEFVDCKVDDGTVVWLHVPDSFGGYFVPNEPPYGVRLFESVRRISLCSR